MKIKHLFKVVSKSDIKPELQSIFVDDNYLYATDTFKGIRVDRNKFKINQNGFIETNHVKVVDIVTPSKIQPTYEAVVNDKQYPSINEFIQVTGFDADLDPLFVLRRKDLIQLLDAMQETKTDTIKFYDTSNVLFIKSDNALGFIAKRKNS